MRRTWQPFLFQPRFIFIVTIAILVIYCISVHLYVLRATGEFSLTFNLKDDRNTSKSSCTMSCVETVAVSWSSYYSEDSPSTTTDIDFTNNSNNISGFPNPIVPDIVHLIYFRKREITFDQLVCIRSIVDHHKPSAIFLHCSECVNETMEGKYWNMLGEKYRRVIKIIKAIEPEKIYGRNIRYLEHASDIARIGILMKYGGIYLDNDVYVVRGLHGFRHYEMAISWDDEGWLGTQVLIAHKDARFLKHWMDSYHNYQRNEWYFNAGQFPTTSILYERPELIHRVKFLFGVNVRLFDNIFLTNWKEWTNQYTIHLLLRYRPYHDSDNPIKTFDEINIKSYDRTYGQMARLVMFGKPDLISN